MSILTKDRLNVSFRAHARIQLRPGSVKKVVEELGAQDWYDKNVRHQFRAAVRAQVQQMAPLEVKSQYREIARVVMAAMNERYGTDSPVQFMSIDIGDIQYPEVVVLSVIRKFETNERNEMKDIELRIAQEQRKIDEAKAHGKADAQRVIRATLDPMFLQYEALAAIEELAGSPNTTFLVMPLSKNGQSPVIISVDK